MGNREASGPIGAITRRTALGGFATGLAGLAGCSWLGGGDGQTTTASPTTEGDDDAATPTETRTPTGEFAVGVPEAVRIDEAFEPRITGLAPVQTVTLTTELSTDGGPWRSSATFIANGNGEVFLESKVPVDGDYDDVDSMGPVWSMTFEGEGDPYGYWYDPLGEYDLTYTAEAGGRSVSDAVTVQVGDPAVTEREVQSDDLVGWWYEPPGDGPHPAVLTLHGSGANTLRARSAVLASHGYSTLALQYFGADGLPSTLSEVPLEYVRRAADWLLERDATAGESLGVYGVSRGGELALLYATLDERVSAVVSDSGSPYVWPSLDGTAAAWTRDGEPVPYVENVGFRDVPLNEIGAPIYRDAFAKSIAEAEPDRRDAATIPVEAADAPILFLSGTEDQLWPSTMLGTALVARLDAAGYDHSYDHLAYRDVGHSIGFPYWPTTPRPGTSSYALGGEAPAQAAASADAWPRVLDLLGHELAT